MITLTNLQCLPKTKTEVTLHALPAYTSISFVHHGDKLVVVYSSILTKGFRKNTLVFALKVLVLYEQVTYIILVNLTDYFFEANFS